MEEETPKAKGRGALFERLKQRSQDKGNVPGAEFEEDIGKVPAKSQGRAKLLQKLLEQRRAGGDPTKESLTPLRASTSAREPPREEGMKKKIKEILAISEPVPQPEQKNEQKREYRGSFGRKMNATTNYIFLEVEKDKGVFQYDVRFEPDVDNRKFRFNLVNTVLGEYATVKSYDGDVCLYLPSKIYEGTTTFSTELETGVPIKTTLIYRRQSRLSECLHLYNVTFKRIMAVLSYTRIGRNYFNSSHKQMVPQHKLEILPGHCISADEMEGGLMLQLDTQHKVIRTQTVYELMMEIKMHDMRFTETVRSMVIGEAVFTKYNNQTYVVDDINFIATPKDTFPTVRGEVSFYDYYKDHYNITIEDINQPMLVIKKPKKMRREGDKVDFIMLVPELCYLTGLSDAMRADFKVMKDVAVHTRITPNQRMKSLRTYLQNVRQSEQAQKILANWGLRLSDRTVDVESRCFGDEPVFFGTQNNITFQGGTDWGSFSTSKPVTGPVDIKNWLLFYTPRDERNAKNFAELMNRLSRNMGCIIKDPKFITLKDDRSESYKTAIEANLDPYTTQVCVFICPTLRTDRYTVIKKICETDKPVASQCVLSKTLSNDKKVRTIVHKIALQITCKLGGTLWSVKMPFSNWMVCGIDVYHNKGQKSVCGFVSSINNSLTRWFSKAVFQDAEIGDYLKVCFRKGLEAAKRNNHFPCKIIVFRDGVGDGQLDYCLKYEVEQFKEVLKEMNLEIGITFVVIQKRISTRIFTYDEYGQETNPPAGTVVDRCVTRRNLADFYLIPQTVRQGTVNPSHYIVLHDDNNFNPDVVQRLAYKLCHLYYNWSGTIRVPAPCQYAHKLAQLVGMYLKKEPASSLAERLHFL